MLLTSLKALHLRVYLAKCSGLGVGTRVGVWILVIVESVTILGDNDDTKDLRQHCE